MAVLFLHAVALQFTNVFVPDSAILGEAGHGLAIAQLFVYEYRLRQAAGSVGAAKYCLEESIKYTRKRSFGEELSTDQSIQSFIVELQTDSYVKVIDLENSNGKGQNDAKGNRARLRGLNILVQCIICFLDDRDDSD